MFVFGGGFAMRLHRNDAICGGAGTVLLWQVCFSVDSDEIIDFGVRVVRVIEIREFRV